MLSEEIDRLIDNAEIDLAQAKYTDGDSGIRYAVRSIAASNLVIVKLLREIEEQM